MSDIDFVIPWVDGSDPVWQDQLRNYIPETMSDEEIAERYRDWGLLKYWFRGVEKFSPWVRKIHFITSGHVPDWLDINHPKINIVRHEDYIPKEYLPVFSSHPIELFIHKIDDLSEKFVYFNDDMFLIKNIDKEYFFNGGLPCDFAAMNALTPGGISHILMNNIEFIANKYNKRNVIRNNICKWFNFQDLSLTLRTIALLPWPSFTGFHDHHGPQPYLKSTFETVWDEAPEMLLETASSRFRKLTDINQYIFRYTQLCKGEFKPFPVRQNTKFFIIGNLNISDICQHIKGKKSFTVSLNDASEVDYEASQQYLHEAFSYILNEKSSFERL